MKAKLLFPKPLENSRKQPKPVVATKIATSQPKLRLPQNKNRFRQAKTNFSTSKPSLPHQKRVPGPTAIQLFFPTKNEVPPLLQFNYHYHESKITFSKTTRNFAKTTTLQNEHTRENKPRLL